MQHFINVLTEENLILKNITFGIEQSLKNLLSNLYLDQSSVSSAKLSDLKYLEVLEENKELTQLNFEFEERVKKIVEKSIREAKKKNEKLEKSNFQVEKLKEHIAKLKQQIEILVAESCDIKARYEFSSRQSEVLLNENEEIRRKLSNLTKVNEKVCVNCRKSYFDEENFNWSCKNHLSAHSGNVWWCCGRKSVEAEGCKVSKHVSREDSEVEKTKTNYKVICSSCKNKGHTSANCFKDPNYKSNSNSVLEIERLKILQSRKLAKKTSISILNNNLKKHGMNWPLDSSVQSEKAEDEETQFNRSFDDILLLKKSTFEGSFDFKFNRTSLPVELEAIEENDSELLNVESNQGKRGQSQFFRNISFNLQS